MLLSGLLLSAAILLAPPISSVVGQWESVERSRGGIGNIVEFRPDGTVSQLSAAMGDAIYRVEGSWLVTSWKDPESGKSSETVSEISFEGDALIEKAGEGENASETRMSRVGQGPKGRPPIVGKWCYEYLPGVNALREFTEDGRMFWRLPLRPSRGRYISAGDTLSIEMEGSEGKAFTYKVEGELLTLTSKDGGGEQHFRKAQSTLLAP
jgi:hypothetical protein